MVRKLACGLVLIACGLILLKKTDVGVVLIFRTNYSDVNVGITYVGTAVAKGAGEKSYSTIIVLFIYFCRLVR